MAEHSSKTQGIRLSTGTYPVVSGSEDPACQPPKDTQRLTFDVPPEKCPQVWRIELFHILRFL